MRRPTAILLALACLALIAAAFDDNTACDPDLMGHWVSFGKFNCAATPPRPPTASPEAGAFLLCDGSKGDGCIFGHYLQAYYYPPNYPPVLMYTSFTGQYGQLLCPESTSTGCTHGPFYCVYNGTWNCYHYVEDNDDNVAITGCLKAQHSCATGG